MRDVLEDQERWHRYEAGNGALDAAPLPEISERFRARLHVEILIKSSLDAPLTSGDDPEQGVAASKGLLGMNSTRQSTDRIHTGAA